jgi:uncharacterized membrane protein HdeD (DUF308 family)
MIEQTWRAILVRGLAAIGFAIVALLLSPELLPLLSLLFGMYALVDGAIGLAPIVLGRSRAPWIVTIALGGLVGISAGLFVLLWPELEPRTLTRTIGAWAIAMGLFELAAAQQIPDAGERREGVPFLSLAGAASIVTSAVVLLRVWGRVLVVTLAIYATIFGALMIGFALHLRSTDASAKRS